MAQGCSTSPAKPDNPPVQCLHPVVNVSTNADIARAVEAYRSSLELCNKLNGY